MLGNPFLGSVTAFLTLLLLIRIIANFYIVVKIANQNPNVDAVQIASAHFVFLCAYAVWVGTLSSCRIGLALPRPASIDFAPRGRRFRSMFRRRVAFFRPVTAAYLSIMLLTTLVFSTVSGNWDVILLRGLAVMAVTLAGVAAVTAVASGTVSRRSDIQIMEILYLLLLLALNPDVGSFKGVLGITLLFGSLRFSFAGLWELGLAVGGVVILAFLVLAMVRVLAGAGSMLRRRGSSGPIGRWYWRFVRIRSWAFLYSIVTPIFVSSTVSPGTKRWALFFSILFAAAAYLLFISHCENTLREKWRCSLFDRGSTGLLVRSALNQAALTAVPVLGYIVFR
jgi:hypothetical protein